MFQNRLSAAGIQTIIPDGKDRENAQKYIFEIKDTKSRHDRKEISQKFVEIGERMIARGAEAILIGCTEISIVVNPDSFAVRGFDALTILARAAIREAGLKPSLKKNFISFSLHNISYQTLKIQGSRAEWPRVQARRCAPFLALNPRTLDSSNPSLKVFPNCPSEPFQGIFDHAVIDTIGQAKISGRSKPCSRNAQNIFLQEGPNE